MDPASPPDLAAGLVGALAPALVAAVFAAASSALGALPSARLGALRESLSGGARGAVDRYIAHTRVIESRWLVLRALGVAASATLIGRLVPGWGFGWRFLVAAVGALVMYAVPAEIGMVLAARTAERSAPLLLRLVQPLELLVAPLAAPISWLGRLVARMVERPPNPRVTETEVEIMVTEGELNGSLGHDQSEMIRNVLDFGDLSAGQVMVPRTRVLAMNLDQPADELVKFATENGHSRYPVYRERIDNVVGVLHVKDLLARVLEKNDRPLDLSTVMRKPVVFVPEGQAASSVLEDMRAGRHHMAIVIDEFGGMSGIVTLEDLVEEIVGDIRDEHDSDDAPIVDLGDGRLMVDAAVSIADLSRYLGAELRDEGRDSNSLGGFVVERMGRVPEAGERLTAFDLEFVVAEADERRVAKVEIVRPSPPRDSLLPKSTRVSLA